MLNGWPHFISLLDFFTKSQHRKYGTSTLFEAVTHFTLPPQYWHWGPCHPSLHRHVPFRQTPLPHSTSLHRSSEHCAKDVKPKTITSSSSGTKLVATLVVIVEAIRFRRYLDLNKNRNMSDKTCCMTCGNSCRLTKLPNFGQQRARVSLLLF